MTTLRIEPPSRRITWLLAAALVVALVARLSFLGSPFVNDPGLYAAMGKTVVEGRQLYVDLWDTKLPGITLLTAPLWAALGNHWWAWVAVQVALMGVAVAALADAAGRVASPERRRATRAATAIVGLASINLHPLLITGFQLETPMLACSCLAAWAFARVFTSAGDRGATGWSLLAGLFAGMAATLKPNAVAVAVAGGIGILLLARRGGGRHAARPLVALAVGVGLMAVVNLAWFSYLKVWPYLGELVTEIGRYSSGTPWVQILTAKTVVLIGVLLWPPIVLIAAARVRPRAGNADAVGRQADPAAWAAMLTLGLAWLAFEIAGTVLQKRGYAYHFLPIAAPGTLVAGLVATRLDARRRPAATAIGIAPLLAWSLASSAPLWTAIANGRTPWPRELIAYLRSHTSPTDTVFADPAGEISVLADRPVGSRVGMMISFVNHDGAPAKFGRWLLDDLESRRCTIICLPIPSVLEGRISGWEKQPVLSRNPARDLAYRAAWDRYLSYVHRHYVREATLDGRDVWRRRPDETSAAAAATTRP